MKSYLKIFIIILLLILAAYFPVLKAGFNSLDDQFSIVNNERLRDPGSLGKIFASSFFKDTHYYRPMVEASFFLEYRLFKLNPFYYHLDNILIHALNACLVFILIGMIFKEKRSAFFVALLFAIHPIQSEAIVNIAGRSILLSCFFSLLSFITFILIRRQRFKILYYMVSIVCFLLSLLSKESGAMLPVIFLSYAVYIGKKRGEAPLIGIISTVPYWLVLLSFIYFRHVLGISELYHWGSIQESILGFLSFLRGVITYFGILIYPIGLHFDRSQEIFISWNQPQIIFTIIFWLLLVTILFKMKKKLPVEIKFFLTWFAFELFPVSQIMTTIGVSPGYISLAEHFLYVASIGFYSMAVLVIQKIYMKISEEKLMNPKLIKVAIGGFLAFLFLMTMEQATYAGNIVAMYRRSAEINPNNARVMFNLGLELAKEKKFKEAEEIFRKAIKLDPGKPKIRIALGKSLCDQGKYLGCADVYHGISDAGSSAELLRENKNLTYQIILKKAEAFEAKGDMKNAVIYYERYLYSRQKNIDEIIHRLNQINRNLIR